MKIGSDAVSREHDEPGAPAPPEADDTAHATGARAKDFPNGRVGSRIGYRGVRPAAGVAPAESTQQCRA